MNEKMLEHFRAIAYNAVSNVFETVKTSLNDIYTEEKYHPIWLIGIFDGVSDVLNILIGEIYKDKPDIVQDKYEMRKEELKSGYIDANTALLDASITILALNELGMIDGDNISDNIGKIKRKSRHDPMIM